MNPGGPTIDQMSAVGGRVVYVPVRHHSPGCAVAVRRLIRTLSPGRILIEGPGDFTPRIAELGLEHRPPLAIYTWLRLADGSRRGSFYPFCDYSPEWVAVRDALEAGIPVAFIDLPFAELAGFGERPNGFSDGDLRRSQAIRQVASRLGVDGFDGIWDELIEVHPNLGPADYLRRAHLLCSELRTAEGEPDPVTQAREACMAGHIREALRTGPWPVLVVTGGFHSLALAALVAAEGEPVQLPPAVAAPVIADRGLALTPYSFRRLDQLAGYDAGMPGPAFYQRVWDDRRDGGPVDGERLISDIAFRLRSRRHPVSTADLIAWRLAGRGLAQLRGHAEVWRTDLVDAARATLIKDELPERGVHPVQAEIDEALRGGARGALAATAQRPPLVLDIAAQLAEHGIDADERSTSLDLSLLDPEGIARSRVLHRLALIGISGIERLGGTDFRTRDDLSQPRERWGVRWSPEQEASAIEASALGATLADAADAALGERLSAGRAQGAANQAGTVAGVVLDSALAGMDAAVRRYADVLRTAIAIDPAFVSVATAADLIAYLYRFDRLLGTTRSEPLGRVLEATWERGVWLLDQGAATGAQPAAAVQGIRTLLWVWERCRWDLCLDDKLLDEVLARLRDRRGASPLLRGAAAGARWSIGLDDAPSVLQLLRACASPEALGDVLTGVFALAREAVQRRREVLDAAERFVDAWDDDEFLAALPAMRLAFAAFPPRERHHISRIIAGIIGGSTGPASPIQMADSMDVAAGMRHEQAVMRLARALGLRCSTWTTSETAPDVRAAAHEAMSGPDDGMPVHLPEARRMRWRLILGSDADRTLGGCSSEAMAQQDAALDFLYRHELGADRNIAPGGSGDSQLTVPEWINRIHVLFPKRTIERLERDALERYQFDEVVTNPELLRRAEPSQTLLKAILHTKHLMNAEVLSIARQLVKRVVEQLMERLATPVRQPFQGNRLRRPSSLRIARNFDARTTIRRNLAHWDGERRQLMIRTPHFISRVRRHCEHWQVIVLVDESGSMADNVIHAAVTAAILFGLPGIRTHLVLFDTNVVDVTEHAGDPVETIMKVQLGGGTDIGGALVYAEGLIDQPRRAIVVLVSDFAEGAPPGVMLGSVKRLVDQGSRVLGLAALDQEADPCYDREMAARMVRLGAHVGAMTPGELADWIAERIG